MEDFGQMLRRLRTARGMSLRQFAKVAGIDFGYVGQIERGERRCSPQWVEICDQTLDAGGTLIERHRATAAPTRDNRLVLASAAPATDEWGLIGLHPQTPVRLDAEYIESLRARIRDLVELDIQFGGDQSSKVAFQLFRAVHRKLGQCDPGPERDLHAVAGELGEVTGWLLYDAGEHGLVRRVNLEALHLSQLAGDHSMELLILQNVSMHAGHLGRPGEALRVARMVLETNSLSPRLEALFRVREARALALAGETTAAKHTFHRARSLYLDGLRDDDPAWAWWINDQELAWHEAMIYADSDEWSEAVDTFQTSIELTPAREVRRRYNHLAALLDAQAQTEAWHDADQTIGRVMPYVDEVGSTRTATVLLGAISQLDTAPAASRVHESSQQLRHALCGAGYSS